MTEVAPQAVVKASVKKGGPVVPHTATFGQRVIARIVYLIIRLAAFTMRFHVHVAPGVIANRNRPVIFCAWHNRLALSLLMYRQYARKLGQSRRLAAMVSASRDGAMLARILEHFGTQPVRGSSSRRGPQALLELKTWAERGYDLAITPDGPRGPCYVFQPGAIALAQVTGRPIVPGNIRIGWKFCLRSWDRFQVPLPFSRVDMSFGEPISIPRESSDAEREALRAELQKRLLQMDEDVKA